MDAWPHIGWVLAPLVDYLDRGAISMSDLGELAWVNISLGVDLQ